MSTWAEVINPANITGAGGSLPDSGSGGLSSGLETAVATSSGTAGAPPWSPDSGLFWFAVVLAVTAVAIGASVSVKAGPFKGAASAK